MTDLERFIDRITPGFVVSESRLVEKFHIVKWWRFPLDFIDGAFVPKDHIGVANGFFGCETVWPNRPLFVLNDSVQMRRLYGSVWNAMHGMAYFNPFWRQSGWYIVIARNEGLFRDDAARDIEESYSRGGHRALVVFEDDGLEDVRERVSSFVSEFMSCHDTSYVFDIEGVDGLGDTALQCLSMSKSFFPSLSEEARASVLDELVEEYSRQEPMYDMNSVDEDMECWKSIDGKTELVYPCFIGNSLLNTFIRSRFDSYAKNSHRKSLKSIWADMGLMRGVIEYDLSRSNGRFHQARFLARMMFKHCFRTVSNLNQCFVYNQCLPYAVPGGVFYDPCAGWGGRMLAACALKMKYVAIDANRRLVDELNALASYMGYDAEIWYGDSSDGEFVRSVMKGRKSSLSFTCPPYWNEEWYSDDPFQSNVKCRSKREWYAGFFIPMLSAALDVSDGPFIVSCDEKVEWGLADGVEVSMLECGRFNAKREDPYFIVRKKD